MNEYDSTRMGDVLAAQAGLVPRRRRIRRRRAGDEHLLDPRQGGGQGVLAAGPVARAQAPASRHPHRSGRMRGQPGGSCHPHARALCRPGVRSADAASPARDDRRNPPRWPAPGGREFPRDREIRPVAGAARHGHRGLRVDHGRLQQVLQLLRGALHARRGDEPARRAGARGDPPAGVAGRGRDHAAGAERECLRRLASGRRADGSGRAHPGRERDARRRAHPLHHLAPAELQRQPHRCVRAHAQAGQPHAPARAERLGPHPGADASAATRCWNSSRS